MSLVEMHNDRMQVNDCVGSSHATSFSFCHNRTFRIPKFRHMHYLTDHSQTRKSL